MCFSQFFHILLHFYLYSAGSEVQPVSGKSKNKRAVQSGEETDNRKDSTSSESSKSAESSVKSGEAFRTSNFVYFHFLEWRIFWMVEILKTFLLFHCFQAFQFLERKLLGSIET